MSCEFCHSNPHAYNCPNAPEPKCRGQCATCYLVLREDYPYVIDNEGNTFCCDECAKQYHGIKEVEWEEEDE